MNINKVMVDIMESKGRHSMWFTFCDIQQFSVLFKNEDGWYQQERKTVRKFKNWPIFMFIYFSTSTFQRETATSAKTSSGSLSSCAGDVLGISVPIQRCACKKLGVIQCSECSMPGTQQRSTWFGLQGLWEGLAFREQSERFWGSGGLLGREGGNRHS